MPINDYSKTIDHFVISTKNNLSFQNGMNVFITKPVNDSDALTKGFKFMHTDEEQNGNWNILFAKDIFLVQEIKRKYRAVLYMYKDKQHIVLYRKEKANQYYFRIHPVKY